MRPRRCDLLGIVVFLCSLSDRSAAPAANTVLERSAATGLRMTRRPLSTRDRAPEPHALPQGWRAAQDMSGRKYYYHVVTKKSVWQLPDRRSFVFARFPVSAPTRSAQDQEIFLHPTSDIHVCTHRPARPKRLLTLTRVVVCHAGPH